MHAKLGHAKFQPCSARGTFLNWEINGWVVGNSVEDRPYLENDER